MLGNAKDSPRQWIMAMGHGAAKLDQRGVHGTSPFVTRVLRDKRWKVWVNTDGAIDQLYDMKNDPYEKKNLLSETETVPAAAASSLAKLRQVVASLPKQDARPRYTPRAANPWDRKPDQGKAKKKRTKKN